MSLSDLLHLGGYSARVSGPMRSLPTEEITAAEAFDQAHLGGAVMTRFLKPFLAGVLLESELGRRLHTGDLLLVAAKARRLSSAIAQVRTRLGPGDRG